MPKARRVGLAIAAIAAIAAIGAIVTARSPRRRQTLASGSFTGSADSWPPVVQAPVVQAPVVQAPVVQAAAKDV